MTTSTYQAIAAPGNMTIEFWFKPGVAITSTSVNYLMSLYGGNKNKEYFTIKYDSSKGLLCAPFAYTSASSPIV